MSTDLELVRDVAARGERARRAMALLFERHFRVLCRRFGYQFPAVPENDMVDVVSACLLKAFENANKFRGEASFQSWVGVMIRNALIDYLRERKRELPLASSDEDPDSEIHLAGFGALIDEKTPHSETELAQLRECVAIHFARFQAQYPEAACAIHEHFVEQTDLKELAIVLGRSYGATRQFVSKEVAKLRHFLAPCLAHLQA